MKRFKAALPCGSWSKEDLVEDANGAFVKYEEVIALQHELAICMDALREIARQQYEPVYYGDNIDNTDLIAKRALGEVSK